MRPGETMTIRPLAAFILMAVVGFSFMPPRTFGLAGQPTLENYVTIFESTSYISLLWSLGMIPMPVSDHWFGAPR